MGLQLTGPVSLEKRIDLLKIRTYISNISRDIIISLSKNENVIISSNGSTILSILFEKFKIALNGYRMLLYSVVTLNNFQECIITKCIELT